MLEDLRWLLEQPSMTDPLRSATTGFQIPMLDVHDGRTHVPDGCAIAVNLPDGDNGPMPTPYADRYPTVQLGDIISGHAEVCDRCIQMHLAMMSSVQQQAHWNLVKHMPSWARDLRRLEAAAAAPLTDFWSVPWSATRTGITPGYSAEMRAATDRLQAGFDTAVEQLAQRIASEQPHWLHVRYAAEANGDQLPAPHVQQCITGGLDLTYSLGRSSDEVVRALEQLLEATAATLATDRSTAVLYRVSESGVSLRHRHLLPPVTHFDNVLVLAVPRSYAPHVDADQRFRCAWLDLPEGWQTDPGTMRQLETTAQLWSDASRDDAYRDVDVAWHAAARLVG